MEERWNRILFRGAQWKNKRKEERQNWNMGNSNSIQWNLFTMSAFNYWKRFFRWQWIVSIRGDIQNVAGRGPEQHGLLRTSLPTNMVLIIYTVSLKRYLTFMISFSFKYAQILAKHWHYGFKVHSGTYENCTMCGKILAWTKPVSCYWNKWSWKAENQARRWDYFTIPVICFSNLISVLVLKESHILQD